MMGPRRVRSRRQGKTLIECANWAKEGPSLGGTHWKDMVISCTLEKFLPSSNQV